MAAAVRPAVGSWPKEPITSAGRVGGLPLSMPDAAHPDVGARLPALVREAGLEIVDAWAEAQAGVGPGPVSTYLASLTGVDPGDDPVVLPPLVTVLGRKSTGTRVPFMTHSSPDLGGQPAVLPSPKVRAGDRGTSVTRWYHANQVVASTCPRRGATKSDRQATLDYGRTGEVCKAQIAFVRFVADRSAPCCWPGSSGEETQGRQAVQAGAAASS